MAHVAVADRYRVMPSLILIDCVALAVARFVVSLGALSTVLMAVASLSLNAVFGLYKVSDNRRSLLRQLPVLAGCALVAGAVTVVIRIQTSLPGHNGPIYAALAFAVTAAVGRSLAHASVRRQGVNVPGR